MQVDVLILGAGPAGSSAAISLRKQGLTVAVIEKTDFSNFRIGETVSAAIESALQRLDVDESVLAGCVPSYANHSIWGAAEPAERNFIYDPLGHGWHLDRKKFDSRLSSLALEKGAHVFLNASIIEIDSSSESNWKIRFQKDEQEHTVSARFAIDATGRNAVLAKRQGSKRLNDDHLIALTTIVDQVVPGENTNHTSIESTANGWWYCADLPDQKMACCYFTDADIHKHQIRNDNSYLQKSFQRTALIKERMKFGLSEFQIFPANSYCMSKQCGKDWLSIGDAAMAYDPLSSSGIVRAINDGIKAAMAIAQYFGGASDAVESLARTYGSKYQKYLAQRNQYYSMERRWPHEDFWSRRHN